MFENRVLRRTFWPKRDEVTEEWRKLHEEELIDLYSSLSIVQVTKLRRMRWEGHVARMGGEVSTGFWWGNLRERDHLEDPGINGKVTFKWIFRSGMWGHGLH